jgi:hypothetical protein
MRRLAAVLALAAAIVVGGLAARPGAEAQSWPGCDGFDTPPEAQAYWESHGRPAQADGDHDGRVCVIYSG